MNVDSLDRRVCALQIGVSVSRISLLVLTFWAFPQTLNLPQVRCNYIIAVHAIWTHCNCGLIMRSLIYLKHMPPFVVLNIPIKMNNLIGHKATNNEQLLKSRMSDHHWPSSRLKLNDSIYNRNSAHGRLHKNLYFFSDQCINRNFCQSSDYQIQKYRKL